jgi:hypothetical protein
MPSLPSSASVIHVVRAIMVVVLVGCAAKTLSVGSNGGPCGAGTKTCSVNMVESCVSTSDPSHGCARTGCVPCFTPNGMSMCDQADHCAIGACLPGFFDCNNDPADGCEVNGNTDFNHCGISSVACDTSCADTLNSVTGFNVRSVMCGSGQCIIDTCTPGWKDCDLAVTNGCERNVLGSTCGSDHMSPCCGLCNGCPVGQTCDTTTNRCGSGAPSDGGNGDGGGNTGVDASIDVQPPPAPPGLAGFVFVVDSVVQTPMTCPSDNWEFAPPPAAGGQAICMPPVEGGVPVDGGVSPSSSQCPRSAILMNTGRGPMAYIAHSVWIIPGYRPGVATGEPAELVGVLGPGAQVDITSVYVGGIVAILGSASPFSSPDAGKYAFDEGVVPWPAGVSGSGGAAQMQVAQIEVRNACGKANPFW